MKTLQTICFTFLLFPSLLILGGCGIKPENVEPPQNVKQDTFPNVYPNIATDPTSRQP